MANSSSPPLKDSSFTIDIEKGSAYDGPLSPIEPSSRSNGLSPNAGLAAGGAFTALKRHFDRNPATVVSGRYSITFRQILLLLVITSAIGIVAYISITSETLEPELPEIEDIPNVIDTDVPNLFVPPAYVAQPGDTASARERFERVRGKGTRTSLRKIQFAFLAETAEEQAIRERRLKAVRDGFAHAWNGYKKHAWGHDEVVPVTGGFKDNFNGWGATMIDSLDTLVLMGFNKEFDEALEWVKTSFDMTKNPTAQLQFFETIIRYLGGFLSAYDLTGEKVLLDKAEELGNYMLNAFVNQNFPSSRVATQKSANHQGYSFVLAEIGTIQVEFSRLSMLTKNPIYDEKARNIFRVLGTATADIPGLLPSMVQDNENRHYGSFQATVGGMVDSYYEYLLKEWILLDGKAPEYREMFERSIESVGQYMVTRPDNGSEDYALIGSIFTSSKAVTPEMEHLGCFIAGSLAMGAKYFDRPQDLVLARQVAEGCYLTYHHSVTGIGPEAMKFDPVPNSNGRKFVPNKETFYNRATSRREYILRPETLESLWILYRLTGDKKYQDQAWEIFQALEKSCRTEIAYSGLRDVNMPGSHDDKMESFFMAETMKYLYLMFSTPDVLSLDSFVFNTEAHPVRRT